MIHHTSNPRAAEYLALTASGLSKAEIAARCGVSVRTVQYVLRYATDPGFRARKLDAINARNRARYAQDGNFRLQRKVEFIRRMDKLETRAG